MLRKEIKEIGKTKQHFSCAFLLPDFKEPPNPRKKKIEKKMDPYNQID